MDTDSANCRADTTVRLRSNVIQHGRTMALIRGTMESIEGKTVYAVCDHHKVHVPSLPAHLRLQEELRRQRKASADKVKL